MHADHDDRVSRPEFAHLFPWHIDGGVPAIILPGMPRTALRRALHPTSWERFGLVGVPYADLGRVLVAVALLGFLLFAGDALSVSLYTVLQVCTWIIMASAGFSLLSTMTQRPRSRAFTRKWGHQVVFGPSYAEVMREMAHEILHHRAQEEGRDISDRVIRYPMEGEKRLVLSAALAHEDLLTSPEDRQRALDAVHHFRETRSEEAVQVLSDLSVQRVRRHGEEA